MDQVMHVIMPVAATLVKTIPLDGVILNAAVPQAE
jgi:hypothetical protein